MSYFELWTAADKKAEALAARLAEVEGERCRLVELTHQLANDIARCQAAGVKRVDSNAELAAENARLRQQRDTLTNQLAEARDHQAFDDLRQRLADADREWSEGYNELADECDAMRSVVGPAVWFAAAETAMSADPRPVSDEAVAAQNRALETLLVAVDTYQKAQTEALTPPLSPSEPEVVHGTTDGAGEQGEARGAPREVWVADDPHDEYGAGQFKLDLPEPTFAEAMAMAVGAMPADARFERKSARADPPWLAEAIEAGWAAVNINGSGIDEAIRAAVPLIARGVLVEAADELPDFGTWDTFSHRVEAWLRERAARQVSSNG